VLTLTPACTARTLGQPNPPPAIKMTMEAVCMMIYLATNPPSVFGTRMHTPAQAQALEGEGSYIDEMDWSMRI
jgi:hypothetical protein